MHGGGLRGLLLEEGREAYENEEVEDEKEEETACGLQAKGKVREEVLIVPRPPTAPPWACRVCHGHCGVWIAVQDFCRQQ
jgi:hypothetical protein